MINLSGIYKIYETAEVETCALNNINLSIEHGDFISIMGPSGCGKSTLLNILGLLDTPSKGSITVDSQEIINMSDNQLARVRNEKFGFIFQSFHLIPGLNILENVELPFLYSKTLSAKEIRERALATLDRVGLSNRTKHFPSQLSGGQCQRVAIARAVIMNPILLLADEPTGNLDSKMGAEIMDLLIELNAGGSAVVVVTHDHSISEMTQKRIIMADGTIKEYIK